MTELILLRYFPASVIITMPQKRSRVVHTNTPTIRLPFSYLFLFLFSLFVIIVKYIRLHRHYLFIFLKRFVRPLFYLFSFHRLYGYFDPLLAYKLLSPFFFSFCGIHYAPTPCIYSVFLFSFIFLFFKKNINKVYRIQRLSEKKTSTQSNKPFK
ncbi:hypothetical protein, unlikely [Trypanosoma brucei gambiense DAL972]|uniref:Uncharacterized protein n=1 Tax=Trypanosoma brucei gambiense (strain MHOM/CI/86/DAL972) TaxID=679716 RepID=D0A0T5_TRYB9|nr:hypothetical protein, unlikely [Trypanosoma brucei gambiense DAL972]CBH16843.1 hypothetical protein, unlikely [Trypanosoma brucei gambiense DAL972]|eukprot:XP_011779107.1 hypothetical protein, unlikely [Trypanosoma brucei gambiense DAL972]